MRPDQKKYTVTIMFNSDDYENMRLLLLLLIDELNKKLDSDKFLNETTYVINSIIGLGSIVIDEEVI